MSEPTSPADNTPEPITQPAANRSPIQLQSGPKWVAPAALVISVLAAAGAGWALSKPAPAGGPGAAADPKAQVCAAFTTVSKAVSLQTKRSPSPDLGPAAPIAAEAIAANARLAMAGGAGYLLDQLPSNAPKQLAEETRAFARDLNGIAMNALAGMANDKEPQAGLLKSVEESNKKIAELCK